MAKLIVCDLANEFDDINRESINRMDIVKKLKQDLFAGLIFLPSFD
jgi:hypothetical protein